MQSPPAGSEIRLEAEISEENGQYLYVLASFVNRLIQQPDAIHAPARPLIQSSCQDGCGGLRKMTCRASSPLVSARTIAGDEGTSEPSNKARPIDRAGRLGPCSEPSQRTRRPSFKVEAYRSRGQQIAYRQGWPPIMAGWGYSLLDGQCLRGRLARG